MNFSFIYQFTDKNSGVCGLTWLDYTDLKESNFTEHQDWYSCYKYAEPDSSAIIKP